MTEHAMRATIQNLPKDLSETYARILENVRLSPGGSVKCETMQKVFQWVAGARRPLTLIELEEAVGLEKTDKFLHLDRVATGAGERLIASCSNLVILNESDLTVTFAHQTVQQYLCSPTAPSGLWPHFSLQSVNEHIAEICLAYLSFSDFETQLTKVSDVKMEQTSAELLVWWNVPLATSIRGLLTLPRALRGANTRDSQRQIKFPAPVFLQPSDALANKYAMLDYIITFWAFHTADLTSQSPYWPVFRQVVTDRQLAFNFRPWDEPEHCARVQQLRLGHAKQKHGEILSSNMRWRTLFPYAWAMRHGIGSLLPLMDQKMLAVYLTIMTQELKDEGLENHWIAEPDAEQELSIFLDITATKGPSQPSQNGFWSGQLILHLIDKYDKDYAADDRMMRRLLDFASRECLRWTDSEERQDAIFCQALLLALESDNIPLFTFLIRYYIRHERQLSAIFVAIVREGHARQKAIEALLFHSVSGLGSEKDMWELFFAIHQCFPIIKSVLLSPVTNTEAFYGMCLSIKRALLVIILAFWKRPSYVERLLSVLGGRTELKAALSLQDFDWRTTTFGTKELYDAILQLDKRSLATGAILIDHLAKEFLSIRNEDRSKTGSLAEEIAEMLDQIGPLFSAKAFESDGVHCLLWAIQKLALPVAQKLLPHYVDFLQDEKNTEMSIDVIKAAAVADADCESVVMALSGGRGSVDVTPDIEWVAVCLSEVSWPDSVRQAIKDGSALPHEWFTKLMPTIKRHHWIKVMGFSSLIT